MKQLTCEMCGSTHLIKQDGVFVCQSCGCKYSVEEAKKMMIEGTVDVSGSTVKVDSTDRLNNLHTLARRAQEENNSEQAQKYYEQIALEEPNDWEANFYKTYYACMQTKIANLGTSCVKLSNIIENTFKLIEQTTFDTSDETNNIVQKQMAYLLVYEKCIDYSLLIVSNMVAQKYYDLESKINFAKEHVPGVVCLQVKLGDVCNRYGLHKQALDAWKASTAFFSTKYSNVFNFIDDDDTKNPIIKRIQSLDPEYKPESSSGCYVATAVYGSYDCPQVWTLRRFRDNILAETWYGRAFIHTYYAISPTLVKWFGHTDWFKKMWKGKLDRMVSNLNAVGVEDTPYEDKNW